MCVDPLTTLIGAGLLGGIMGGGGGSSPAIYNLSETPQAKAANFAQQGLLFQKRRKRRNVKTSPLGLEDEETQKKQLTGE